MKKIQYRSIGQALCLLFFFIVYQYCLYKLFYMLLLCYFYRVSRDFSFFDFSSFGIGRFMSKNAEIIWFHAASVGEVASISSLIKKTEQENQDIRCFVTVSTATGLKTAQAFMDKAFCSRVPFDFFPFLLLTFLRLRPKKIILVEGEFWPGLITMAFFSRIPVIQLNAKMSKRSAGRFAYFSYITRSLFSVATRCYAQNQEMADRFIKLGVSSERVKILGNLKAYNVYYRKKELELKKTELFFSPEILSRETFSQKKRAPENIRSQELGQEIFVP